MSDRPNFEDDGYVRLDDPNEVQLWMTPLRRLARRRELDKYGVKGIIGIILQATDEAGMTWSDFSLWTDEEVFDAVEALHARLDRQMREEEV